MRRWRRWPRSGTTRTSSRLMTAQGLLTQLMRRRPDRLCDVWPAAPAIELEGDQLGELGRYVRHRLFSSAQAASRAKRGADFAESFIRRFVHDGNEQVTRARSAESSLSAMPSAGRRRSSAGSPARSRLATSQALVDGAEQRRSEANALLAESDRDTARLEQIVQLLGGPLPVVPRVA